MKEAEEVAAKLPHVHAVLICEGIEQDANGSISLNNVTEVFAVESLPAEVGPLVFVAFLRDIPPGPCEGGFVLRSRGSDQVLARIPLGDVQVPASFGDRQLALHVRVPKVPVAQGGWYEVAFLWGEVELGFNRFAIGARKSSD